MIIFYLLLISALIHPNVQEKEAIPDDEKEFLFKPTHTFKTKEYEIVVPKKTNSKGHFQSYDLRHFFTKGHQPSEEKGTDKIHFSIPIEGAAHLIELEPNQRLVSESTLVESHKHGRSNGPEIRRWSKRGCHYLGKVKDQEETTAALSTCHGLSGYIRTRRGVYIIEPERQHARDEQDEQDEKDVRDEPHPHVVYRHRRQMLPSGRKQRRKSGNGNNTESTESNDANDVPQELHIETLVVLDQAILRYHKDIDIENFVLTVFNMAHDLFHDASLGMNVNLAIVRLIRLEVEDHEMNVAVTKNIGKALQHFRIWQKKINPKQDLHPNHHDLAVLLTRIDICADEKSCGFLGAARFAGMCDPENQAILAQDNGLLLGFTIAHEIGHTLSMAHDMLPKQEDVDLVHYQSEIKDTVMSPHISYDILQWSHCSSNRLKKFIDSGFGTCLYDPPTDHSFTLSDALPGVLYDGDYQCREMFGPNGGLCMTGLECNNLICYVEDKGCIESHARAADGTICDENKWCFHGECIEMGERPNAVDGKWGPWSNWTDCSRTCGSGVTSQERLCNNPEPKLGGKYCTGESRRFKICSTVPCDLEQPTFRDVQCAEFNSWAYPGDGLIHQWKSYPIHDENQCALYCVNELGNVASLRPRVIDGTTCYRSIRDVCINGICKEIPCDLDLESTAVEDRCGICKGDGTSCEVIRGEHALKCGEEGGYKKKLMEIPKNAFNIKLEEQTPSESRIQIRDKDGLTTYISGESLGIFSVNGAHAWVGMIRTKQEAISIQGPINDDITVWAAIQQNSTLKYSYALKATKKRQASFSWDYVDWSRCSAECGPGIQEAVGKCVEKEAGLVDDSFCKNIPGIREQIRTCEVAPCTPRWFIGDWTECTHCPFGQRSRLVKCFRPVGHGEGELDIISDSYCASPKPKNFEFCSCKKSQKKKKKKRQVEKADITSPASITSSLTTAAAAAAAADAPSGTSVNSNETSSATTAASVSSESVMSSGSSSSSGGSAGNSSETATSASDVTQATLSSDSASASANGSTTQGDADGIVSWHEVRDVYDFADVKSVRLTVHTEMEKGKFPPGLPHPKTNESSFNVAGKEALKFLSVLQADFSNNRTRI